MTSSTNSNHSFALSTSRQSFLDWLDHVAMGKALWSFPFGLSCCSAEYMASFPYDHGAGPERARIEEADVLVFSGSINAKLLPILLQMHQRMRAPKWVMAVGSCAASGGLYQKSRIVWPGLASKIPVDIYVPGCPPRAEVIQEAFKLLKQKMLHEESVWSRQQ